MKDINRLLIMIVLVSIIELTCVSATPYALQQTLGTSTTGSSQNNFGASYYAGVKWNSTQNYTLQKVQSYIYEVNSGGVNNVQLGLFYCNSTQSGINLSLGQIGTNSTVSPMTSTGYFNVTFANNDTQIKSSTCYILVYYTTPHNGGYVRLGETVGGGTVYLNAPASENLKDMSQTPNVQTLNVKLFGDSFSAVVNSPANGTLYLPTDTIYINSTATNNQAIVNASLFIDGTYQNNYQNVTGNTNNTLFNTTIASAGLHAIGIKYCDVGNVCTTASVSVDIENAKLNSVTYTTTTLEGNLENFLLNITTATGLSSASFIYNNTNYPVAISNVNGSTLINSTINVPAITAQTNFIFYWQLNFSTNQQIIGNYSQQVNTVMLDDCSTYTTRLLNLTALDEETQAKMNQTMEVTVDIYPINQYPNSNYIIGNASKTYTNVTNATVCISTSISNTTQYYMDAQIRYSAPNYVPQLYNIQRYLLTNSTAFQSINLFDLPTALDTDFLITVKDANFLPLQGALVMIQRKYLGEGVYKNVEIPKTDQDGQATGHFNLNSVLYQIVIVKNGVTIATYTDISVVCTDKTIGQCYLNLNAVSGSTGINDYKNFGNLNYVLSTNTTGSSSLTFNTLDGTSALMNITSITYGLSPTLLCSSSLLSSAGVITCNIPSSFTNGTFEVDVYSNGNLLTSQIYSLSLPISSRFGYEGYIYLLLLIITIPFMFITDTIGFMVSIAIGFIIAGALFLYGYGSLIGAGSALVWLVVAIGVIIYKLSERRREQ